MRNIINSGAKYLVSTAGATALTVVFAWAFLHATQAFPVY